VWLFRLGFRRSALPVVEKTFLSEGSGGEEQTTDHNGSHREAQSHKATNR